MRTISRRQFLKLAALAAPAVAAADLCLIEPKRLKIRKLNLTATRGCRFVQFSDLHYRGDAEYAAEIVQTINGLNADFVCFTGDLIEHTDYLAEALSFIRQIKTPVY